MRAAFSSILDKSASTPILGKRNNAHNIQVGTPTASAANAAAASFAALVAQLGYLSSSDIELVRKAYKFADEAHLGQLRKNGEPYITHPLEVTRILAELGIGPITLAAALLHDTVEDTDYSLNQLKNDFGDEVAMLVDGVTKLDKVKPSKLGTRKKELAKAAGLDTGDVIWVSAAKGTGMDALASHVLMMISG